MKTKLIASSLTALLIGMSAAGESLKEDLKKLQSKKTASVNEIKETLKKHTKGSLQTATDQDELSADVQDLIQEQSHPKVLKLLNEAEDLMSEATEKLEEKKTGGETIAIQTEIIEKIYDAAKQKKQGG